MLKVQVECVRAESDVQLEEYVNRCCTRLAECGNEVMNISYAIHPTKVFCLYAMIVYKTNF